MEYWEFLLQKEGDRSWLPLESPDVEILEGRYRVVARSSRANTSIEVRIMHQTTDEPPKRRLQKRSGRTNQDGLMVVFPFTRLKPGLWEVRCSGDIMSDFLGKSWQSSVRMQVLSQELEVEDDWEPNWSQPETTSEATLAFNEQPFPSTAPATAEPNLEPAIAPDQVASSAPVPDTSPVEVTADPSLSPSLGTDYSVEQLQHIAEQIFQTGQEAAPTEPTVPSEAETSPATDATQLLEASSDEEAIAANHSFQPTSEPEISEASRADEASEPFSVQLTLDQTAYMARWGRPFTLSGFIERQAPANRDSAATVSAAWQGEVYLCLRDPQSAQILVETRQSLSTQALPYPFSCTVEIPFDCRTRLLLGEITLYSESPAKADAATGLATQEFTITADLDELLEAIAADLNEADLLDLPSESTPPPASDEPPATEASSSADLTYLNLSFLNLGEPAPNRRSFRFQSSAGDPLPPQIYRPGTSEEPKAPSLPPISKNQPQESPPSVSAEAQDSETTPLADDILESETDLLAELDTELQDLSPLADPVETAIDETAEATSVEVEGEAPPAADEADSASTDAAFQSLKLQDRFWTRLNALATDAELSNWLREDEDSAETVVADEPPAELDFGDRESTPATSEPSGSAIIVHPQIRKPEDEWVAHEIVVDDEPVVSPTQPTESPTEAPHPALISADDPIPTPKLEVPAGELVSGKPITVRVRMPDLPARIYVKFWVNDRQTRSLLDGPRWLVDFTPTGFGDLEATTQLTVPFGSLEIQFEGIAVEMATQRESHKVTVERMVVPPDAPSLSLQEWD